MGTKKVRLKRGKGTRVCRMSSEDYEFYKAYAKRNNISLSQAVSDATRYVKKATFGFLR